MRLSATTGTEIFNPGDDHPILGYATSFDRNYVLYASLKVQQLVRLKLLFENTTIYDLYELQAIGQWNTPRCFRFVDEAASNGCGADFSNQQHGTRRFPFFNLDDGSRVIVIENQRIDIAVLIFPTLGVAAEQLYLALPLLRRKTFGCQQYLTAGYFLELKQNSSNAFMEEMTRVHGAYRWIDVHI